MHRQNHIVFTDKKILEGWLDLFEMVGVSKELVLESFSNHLPLPNLNKCYQHILNCRRSLTRFSANFPWQLQFLTGDKAWIQLSLANSQAHTFRDMSGATLLHYAGWSGSAYAVEWLDKAHPELASIVTKNGMNVLHYAAKSGCVEIIKYLLEHHPHLAEEKTNDNLTILHFAAQSGSVSAIEWITEHYPKFKTTIDNHGMSIFHHSVLSGSLPLIKWTHRHYSELAETETHHGTNILHIAAQTGSLPAIKWAIKRYPHFIDVCNHDGKHILHFAALSGSLPTVEWLTNHYPQLIEIRDNAGLNILQYAARSGNVDTMKWLLEQYPHLIQQDIRSSKNVFHCAASSGSMPALKWILAEFPVGYKTRTKQGELIIHFIAYSGSIPMLAWALKEFNILATQETKDRRNILHFIAISGNEFTFRWMLRNHTELSAALWSKDKGGNTPDSLASKEMKITKPTDILRRLFDEAMTAIALNHTESWHHTLLDAFSEKLTEYLASNNVKVSPNLMFKFLKNEKLSTNLKFKLSSFEHYLCLQGINVLQQPLVLPLLDQLITYAAKSIPPECESLFIQSLQELVGIARPSTAWELPSDIVKTLDLLIADFERTTASSTISYIEKLLIIKLLHTSTLSALRPISILQPEITITPANYVGHLEAMKKQAALISLPSEINQFLETTFFPGFEHLLTHQETIIEHGTLYYGKIYMLAPNLPLHTDHHSPEHPENIQQVLDRLITEIIAAFYLAQKAGKVSKFFEQLSDGLCFEGRARHLSKWVTQYTHIREFSEWMSSAYDQYRSYQIVIHGKIESEFSLLTLATDFIAERYTGLQCLPDKTYAPTGDITIDGIKRYLRDMLYLDDEKMVPQSAQALVLAKLDLHLSQMKSALFLKPSTEKETSLKALRYMIATIHKPIADILQIWLKSPSPIKNKTNAQLIAEPRLRFFTLGQQTSTSAFIEALQSTHETSSGAPTPKNQRDLK